MLSLSVNLESMVNGMMVFENEGGAVFVERTSVIECGPNKTVVYYRLIGDSELWPSVEEVYRRDNKIELSVNYQAKIEGNEMMVIYNHI